MKRNYGIDALKIVSMALVIAHHLMMAGKLDGAYSGFEAVVLQTIHSFCYCAVDCFVMATGFVMSQTEWKWTRIVKLWRQIVGYSLLLTGVGCLVLPEGSIGWRDVLNACLPITLNRNWFVTEYFALFFAMPYLQRLLSVLSARELRNLCLGGFVLLSVFPSLAGADLFVLKWGYSFVWFVYLYILGSAIASLRKKGWVCSAALPIAQIVAGSSVSGGAIVFGEWLSAHYHVGGGRIAEFGFSYASPTILMISVGMILFFTGIRINVPSVQKFIEAVVPSVFIVFIVHTNLVFQEMIGWAHVFLPIARQPVVLSVAIVMGLSLALFGVIVLIDWGRRCIRLK